MLFMNVARRLIGFLDFINNKCSRLSTYFNVYGVNDIIIWDSSQNGILSLRFGFVFMGCERDVRYISISRCHISIFNVMPVFRQK